MKTIEEIRRDNLAALLERYPSIQKFADAIDRQHAQVSQWKNASIRRNKKGEPVGISNIDSDSARHIESKLKLQVGWMDNVHAEPGSQPASLGEREVLHLYRAAARWAGGKADIGLLHEFMTELAHVPVERINSVLAHAIGRASAEQVRPSAPSGDASEAAAAQPTAEPDQDRGKQPKAPRRPRPGRKSP